MLSIKKSGLLVALLASFAVASSAHAQKGACPSVLCSGGGGGVLAPPDPPVVPSRPDFAIQFGECLPPVVVFGVPFDPAPSLATDLHDEVAAAMKGLDVNHDDPAPSPEVKQACINGKHNFAIWYFPQGSYGPGDTDAAREAGLHRVKLLQSGESFAFNFTSRGIKRLVNIRWQDQELRLNDDGDPDPNGPVHLDDSFKIQYFNHLGDGVTKRVRLRITGFYDGPTSDTDFAGTVDDDMHIGFGIPRCESKADVSPTETTLDTILAALKSALGFGGAGPSASSFLSEGPGCKIVRLLPVSVLIPFTHDKEVFTYTRLDVTRRGIGAAGTHERKPRTPGVTILGPTLLKVEPGEAIVGNYQVLPNPDLRPPLFVSWTSRDATPVSGQEPQHNVRKAQIGWDIPGLDVGESVQRVLTVTVRDADSAFFSQSPQVLPTPVPVVVRGVKTVNISRVLDSDPPPPPCKAKPWLPECQN